MEWTGLKGLLVPLWSSGHRLTTMTSVLKVLHLPQTHFLGPQCPTWLPLILTSLLLHLLQATASSANMMTLLNPTCMLVHRCSEQEDQCLDAPPPPTPPAHLTTVTQLTSMPCPSITPSWKCWKCGARNADVLFCSST